MAPVIGFFAGAFGWTAAAGMAGFAAGAAFGGTILGSLAVKLLTSVAVSALQMALTDTQRDGGVMITATLRGEDNPETILLGRYATSGQCVYVNSHGKSNRFLTHVVELCSAPGATLNRLMLGDKWVTPDWANPDATYGAPIHGESTYIRYYDGRQTAADPHLVATYGADPDMPWAATAIGTGLCYAILTFYYDDEERPSVPAYRFEMDGIPLYDVRKDSTAGGNGTHRLNNPATWSQTNNPIVMAWNILRGIPLPGGEIYGGGYDLSLLPAPVWMSAMNRCDVAVEIPSGTEPAYRAGIEASLTQEPAQPLTEIFKACSATIADMGYAWTISVGAPGLPVYSFTDDDVIVSNTQTLDPFPSLSETYNAVSARYPSPAHLYESREAPLRTNAAAEASDAFGRRTASLTLPAAPYGRQVQRLTAAWLKDERRFIRHIHHLPPDSSAVELTDTVDWTSARNGYNAKVFSVGEITEDVLTGIRQFSFRERDPSDYDWSSSDLLPEPPTPTVTPRTPEPVDGFDAVGVAIVDTNGQARRAGIQITWNPDVVADALRWRIRFVGQTTVQLRGDTRRLDDGFTIVSEGVLPARSYEVSVRLIKGRKTEWSAWKSLTTPAAYIGAEDVSDTFIDQIEEIADLAGVRTVSSLPAAGSKPNQIVMLVPPGRLYRWDATAGVWTTQLYSGIEPGSLQIAAFAAGIEPISIITSATLPTVKTTTTIVWQGKLYRWSGSAYVASVPATDVTGQLTSAQIASLEAAKLAGQITSTQIGTGAVLNAALADAAISVSKLADSAVTAAKIADGAVTNAKFASGIRPVEIVSALPTSGNFDGRQAYLTSDKRLYRHNGTAWVNSNAADQIVGQLVAGQIAAGAIGASQIAAGAIVASKLAVTDMTNLVPDCDLQDAAAWSGGTNFTLIPESTGGTSTLSTGEIRSAITESTVVCSGLGFTVSAGQNLFFSYQLARSGGTTYRAYAQLHFLDRSATTVGVYVLGSSSTDRTNTSVLTVSGTISVPEGAYSARWRWVVVGANTDAAVRFFAPVIRIRSNGELIVDGAINAAKLAAEAVTAAAIAAGAITTAKIAAGAVTASSIAANAITAVQIAAAAVTAGALAAGAVTASSIAASAVTAVAIAAGAITTSKIAAGAVTANEIAANTITAAKIAAGAIGASQIAAGAILASKLSVSDFTNQVPDSEIQDPASWVRNSKISINTIAPRADSRSLGSLYYDHSLNTDGSDASAYSAGFFPVTPGDELFVSGQVIRVGGTRIQMRVHILFYDRNDTMLATDGSLVAISLWGITTNTSVPYTGTVTVPSGAFQARYRYYIYGAAGETDGNLHLGAPVVRIKSRGELIVDGAINAARIAAGAITAASIAAGAITASAIAAGAVGASQIAAGAVTAAKIAAGSITADKFAAGQIIAGDLIVDGAVSATYTAAQQVGMLINAGTSSAADLVGAGTIAATFAAPIGGSSFPTNPVEATMTCLLQPNTSAVGRVAFQVQKLVSGSWTTSFEFDVYHDGVTRLQIWRGLGGDAWSFAPLTSGTYRLRAWIKLGGPVVVSGLLFTLRQLNK